MLHTDIKKDRETEGQRETKKNRKTNTISFKKCLQTKEQDLPTYIKKDRDREK
jgi:hypothetical protein